MHVHLLWYAMNVMDDLKSCDVVFNIIDDDKWLIFVVEYVLACCRVNMVKCCLDYAIDQHLSLFNEL